MTTSTPHYLLFSESMSDTPSRDDAANRAEARGTGRWRIVLEAVDGSSKLEASDEEAMSAERLELLAVIRGLEAIPEPARVTLVTASRYVSRGLRFGMTEWRESNWQWERFGQMSEITNSDLWRRLDRALRIHQVECRTWRFDLGSGTRSVSKETAKENGAEESPKTAARVPAPHWGFGSRPRRGTPRGSQERLRVEEHCAT